MHANNKFAAFATAVRAKMPTQAKALEVSGNLCDALKQRAFSGTL